MMKVMKIIKRKEMIKLIKMIKKIKFLIHKNDNFMLGPNSDNVLYDDINNNNEELKRISLENKKYNH